MQRSVNSACFPLCWLTLLCVAWPQLAHAEEVAMASTAGPAAQAAAAAASVDRWVERKTRAAKLGLAAQKRCTTSEQQQAADAKKVRSCTLCHWSR